MDDADMCTYCLIVAGIYVLYYIHACIYMYHHITT